MQYIRAHSLNVTDAAILSVVLDYQNASRPQPGQRLILITSDQRLMRAANAEGLATVNPETLPLSDLVGILNSL
jgi:hypothetical protein